MSASPGKVEKHTLHMTYPKTLLGGLDPFARALKQHMKKDWRGRAHMHMGNASQYHNDLLNTPPTSVACKSSAQLDSLCVLHTSAQWAASKVGLSVKTRIIYSTLPREGLKTNRRLGSLLAVCAVHRKQAERKLWPRHVLK